MSRKNSVVVALAISALVLTSLAFGQVTKKRKATNVNVHTTAPTPHPTNGNTAFNGDVGDGTGIKTKKPPSVNSNSTMNSNSTITPKRRPRGRRRP